jgi:hypothetical protein
MNKKIWILSVLVLAIFVASAFAADVRSPRIEDQAKLTGAEPLPDVTAIPWNRDLALDSPGIVVGTTEYDYQTNGSTGNRAFFDTDGGVHFVWMRGSGGSYPPPQRAVYFNYVDNAGNWLVPEIGQNISQANGDGYTQISGTSDNRAAAAYHSSATDFVIYAVDNFPGMGIFSYFDPPDFIDLQCYWPYLTLDRNDNIHVVMQENANEAGAPQAIGYTRSSDGGETWSSLANVDTLETLSHVVVASPVSDKVAIVYTHPRDYNSQYYNDAYYIESEDGITWNWRTGKINITEYGSGEETFWAYTDCAAIYDYDDNLNIVWNALEVSNDTLYYPAHMIHYSTGSGEMTSVVQSEPEWPQGGCDTGAWNLQIAKMSLGVHEATGALYALYTGFHPEDCSAGGYANGDLYLTYSVDGGASWADSVNITDSQTPGCPAGDCDSDHWSSLADNIGSELHILYVNDKDAGGIPQTEGQLTESPLLYMTWPTITAIDDDSSVPTTFALAQNYPNPFNAQTNINFELEKASNVEVSVFDITGARVVTLADGQFEAGAHSINWDAEDVASGVYYYSLKANGEESTRKMTLLK